ncbi:MAG: formylmethanofuran dehydrogenase [Deltaproteobacteria bacterium]|nr:formylmethanofuran dehydrogenase [Deltaproteobacteria bacterium]
MKAKDIMNRDDFKRCEAFHGHICPGLSIGYKAARAGMDRLRETRSEDEEIVAIVETDACCADAVQVLTGCTFGKGNFIYKDHGKMVFTFLSRKTGEGVRVAMRPGAFEPDEGHFKLLQKVIGGTADEKEKERFGEPHFKRSCDILEMTADQLFVIEPVKTDLPPKAEIQPSEPCDRCGEPAMRTKLVLQGTHRVCRDCIEKSDINPASSLAGLKFTIFQ